MRSLPIVCQLVDPEARACDRCGATRRELERAVAVLEHALRPLGVEPHLEIMEIVEIDEAPFTANGPESNRIWIAGKPMEEWLDETVGSSAATPERMIVKAALIASSELIDDVTVSALTAALVGRARNAIEPVCG